MSVIRTMFSPTPAWHYAEVRCTAPSQRLLEWRATGGWGPICRALGVAAPEVAVPHIDGRGMECK